jgi:euchromatic histone-lysine N-methyltransferase
MMTLSWKLEQGNLALKNCIEAKTLVRVIHGFKGQSRSEFGKQTSTFACDGLYEVVEYWRKGPKGGMVFKYKLQRTAEQPELALHTAKAIRKSKICEGLCFPKYLKEARGYPHMCHQHN